MFLPSNVGKSWAIAALLTLSLFLTACGTRVSVRTAFDSNARFESYRSFAMMLPNKPVPTSSVNMDPFTMQKLRQFAHYELKSRNLENVAKKDADLLVAVLAGTERRIEAYTPGYSGYGYGGPGFNSSVDEYTEGTIVIDLIDQKRATVVWRGKGTQRVTRATSDAELRAIVVSILAEYPPGSKDAEGEKSPATSLPAQAEKTPAESRGDGSGK
ncbi:MAG: DUF4136 domain-containing protein [Polyangiaceae bacterium]|nr:DUF4136 domain-containing protein [Polyangiaceae bacterium]